MKECNGRIDPLNIDYVLQRGGSTFSLPTSDLKSFCRFNVVYYMPVNKMAYTYD